MSASVPSSYRLVRIGRRKVFVRAAEEELASAVGFMAGRPVGSSVTSVRGRADHDVFEVPGSATRVIWKRCRRGGLAAQFLGDRFFGEARFIRELVAGETARRADVRVGDLLALAITRRRDGSRRVEQLVRFEEGTRDAAEWLADDLLTAQSRRSIVETIARLVRNFHDCGLRHGDLNLRNILVREIDGGFEGIIIDLDPPPLLRRDGRTAEGNILRLFRSWARLSTGHSLPLPGTDRLRFLDRYCGGDREAARRHWRSAAAAARRGGWLTAQGRVTR